MSARKLKAAVQSHVGNVRENNEDNYYLNGSYRTDVTQEVSQAEGYYEIGYGSSTYIGQSTCHDGTSSGVRCEKGCALGQSGRDDLNQTDQPGYKQKDGKTEPESKTMRGECIRTFAESLIRRVESLYRRTKRKEDSMMKEESPFFLAAVADGMGGEDAGEIASLFAVESLREWDGGDAREAVSSCIQSANARICAKMRERGRLRMGSTIAILVLDSGQALCCNVGDSRIYLLRSGNLEQLSTDHNRAASMVAAGILSAEEARASKACHELTQHLGIPEDEIQIEPALRELPVCAGDLFLLCSDGLSEMVPDPEILALLSFGGTPKEQADRLIDKALAHGGRDNVTVLIVQISE